MKYVVREEKLNAGSPHFRGILQATIDDHFSNYAKIGSARLVTVLERDFGSVLFVWELPDWVTAES